MLNEKTKSERKRSRAGSLTNICEKSVKDEITQTQRELWDILRDRDFLMKSGL